MAVVVTGTRGHAGVIAPPPVIAVATVALGLWLDRTVPAYVLTVLLSLPTRIVLGLLLAGIGGILVFAAETRFRAAGTPVLPGKTTTALVTDGVYAYVRNPMYVGLAFVTGAIAVALASDWTLVLMLPAAAIMHVGVVKREERYLESMFGDAYRRYRERVPRYGWPV